MLVMTLKLTNKETSLLKDQQNHEKICVQKYQTYASQASDPALKQLLSNYAQQEQQHLNSINQMLNGQIPTMTASSSQSIQQNNMQSSMTSTASSSAMPSAQTTNNNENDSALCNDMLMTEKFVSGAYDTAIFECADSNVRQALNHIQKEEQKHGEGIFQYMQSKGMYNPQ